MTDFIFELSNNKGESIRLSRIPQANEILNLIPFSKPTFNFDPHIIESLIFNTFESTTYKTIKIVTVNLIDYFGVELYRVNDNAYLSVIAAFNHALELLKEDAKDEN